MADGIATITGTEYAETLLVYGNKYSDDWRKIFVQGLAGNDTINMVSNTQDVSMFSGTIDGGDGNDVIRNGFNDGWMYSLRYFSINGGNGHDSILNGNLYYKSPEFCTVEGGAGDEITLQTTV